jgi:flagellar biosynthetic protein FlhB
MAEMDQERTEEATQQRRDDFRKRGQVAQTRELGSVFSLLATTMIMWFLGRFFMQQITEIITESIGGFLIDAARRGDTLPAVKFVCTKAVLVLAPFMGILCLVSVAATLVQTGLINNEEALELKLERLNPIEGMKKLFSFKAVLEGMKAIVKVAMVTTIVYLIVRGQIFRLPQMIDYSIAQIFIFVGDLTIRLLGGIGIFMGVLAAIDYFLQRWDLEKQMRMTKQEIKEEHKAREGDPMIKARIRRVQREMASKRMMSEVPKADVIITNPTHIAIALRYDPATMIAPQLIAKGSGLVAEKIKEIAREHNIPVMENKPLARAIFKTLKIGQGVPRELFTAVAQVLSYVYKLKRKAAR